MMRYRVDDLLAFSNRVFVAAGLQEDDAGIVSDVLVHADLRGHASHGLTRIPIYAERIAAGVVNARPSVTVEDAGPSLLLVDADNGPGPVASLAAMDAAIERAKGQGVCAAVVAHSNHNGAGSFYVERAIAEGCIAIAMTNAPPSMAVHGGREAVIGTNPITFGSPVGGDHRMLADMATSVVARGKIVEAAKRGEDIPIGWALDGEGRPTTDARAAERGVVLPLAGAKGSALAVMVETLCGVLAGGRFAGSMGNLYSDFELTQDIGHFFLVLDASRAPGAGGHAARMARLVEELKASAVAEGFAGIMMPGEPEAQRMSATMQSGIALEPNVVDDLDAIAHALGVAGIAELAGSPA
jgi:LDH2 family malate/lactate/ureidoglycolate dehydrogenase